ncbi:MAG: CRISPR-associated helicase Cas3' [Armatimonadetes bacterium]|nr:CRISPR-associated helicase Cas3' [Armatimonadota bacterium]
MPYAHTPNSAGQWHGLQAHLEATAERARAFADRFGAGDLAYYVGLWHDMGKFHPQFQAYLQACAQGKRLPLHPHARYGAAYAKRHCAPLAFPIMGHHAGMPDKSDLQARLQQVADMNQAEQPALTAMPALAPTQVQFPHWLKQNDPLQAEMLIRMLFSCLVDADFLDTEAHFDPQRAAQRPQGFNLHALWQRFEQNQNTLLASAPQTPVNAVRRAVYEDALRAASGKPGLYALTAPTGAGKTRALLAFALQHALTNNLERVIVALPYTSIIDQTADVYRTILGNAVVLEHHSALEVDDLSETALERHRLLSENWDAPLIVTTFVQLFESLFSNLPSRCRKVHRLARSVIVLDEVQTLPVELLAPTVHALQQLIDDYGATVLLSTATQPALQRVAFTKSPMQVVANPAQHFQTLRRVNYHVDLTPRDYDWLADEIAAREQVMVVLNTRKDALATIDALRQRHPNLSVFHLSTLLCPAHRRAVLAEVKRRLEHGEPCRLVATQVVEAGVDLDFPVVMRAVGPLDRIVQAAGRCNREGRLARGEVIVFELAQGSSPRGAYRTGTDEARITLQQPNADLHDPGAYHDYFQRLYANVSLDREGIQRARQGFQFETVAQKYRLIRDDTCPVVIVNYDPSAVNALLQQGRAIVQAGSVPPQRWRQQLHAHTVSLYRREVNALRQQGLIQDAPDLGVALYTGTYDPLTGVAVQADPADLVV